MSFDGQMPAIAKQKLKLARGPLTALTPRHEQVLALLVHGLEYRDSRLNGGDHPVNQPLGVNQVAELLKVRRAYVRDLISDPLFKSKMQAAIANQRAALAPQAISTMAEVMTTVGDNTPADRRVRLDAAKTIMGEDAKGFSVNVQVNNQTNNNTTIRPGYVLDLSALHKPRNEPVTIEGNDG